jgi:site-specific DNA-methyltransferase (adenine-specific)
MYCPGAFPGWMRKVDIGGNLYYLGDCVEGAREHLADGSVDLMVTDPPYGIEGDRLDRHYNRDEAHVVEGYVEVPAEEYGAFSRAWVAEAARVLRPGGSIYIVSGYTNLYHILDALRATDLREVNHIVWRYAFGVHTRRKYVSSHYHVLYYERPGPGRRTFNANVRFGPGERDAGGGSLDYADREDVWTIDREYKPGRRKNRNELPTELLVKMMQYSSRPGDLVCDMFLGGFGTARVAVGLGRRFTGFEVSPTIFDAGVERMREVSRGDLLDTLRVPREGGHANQGQRWTEAETDRLLERYRGLRAEGATKARAMEVLGGEFGRGRFAITNVLKRNGL